MTGWQQHNATSLIFVDSDRIVGQTFSNGHGVWTATIECLERDKPPEFRVIGLFVTETAAKLAVERTYGTA